jgi:hypothetical protein
MIAPFVAGLADVGEKTAERFRAVAERWKVDDNEKKQKIEGVIKEIINAPLNGERPYAAFLRAGRVDESASAPCGAEEGADAHVKGEAEKRRRSGRGACALQDACEKRQGLRGVGWVVRVGEEAS